MRYYRQGDVAIIPTTAIPDGVTPIERDDGRIVLAYGEVTGHAHAILDRDAELLAVTDTDDRFLRVLGGLVAITPERIFFDETAKCYIAIEANGNEFALSSEQATQLVVGETRVLQGVTLQHEEHRWHVYAPGDYVVRRQREYTSADMPPLRVAD